MGIFHFIVAKRVANLISKLLVRRTRLYISENTESMKVLKYEKLRELTDWMNRIFDVYPFFIDESTKMICQSYYDGDLKKYIEELREEFLENCEHLETDEEFKDYVDSIVTRLNSATQSMKAVSYKEFQKRYKIYIDLSTSYSPREAADYYELLKNTGINVMTRFVKMYKSIVPHGAVNKSHSIYIKELKAEHLFTASRALYWALERKIKLTRICEIMAQTFESSSGVNYKLSSMLQGKTSWPTEECMKQVRDFFYSVGDNINEELKKDPPTGYFSR